LDFDMRMIAGAVLILTASVLFSAALITNEIYYDLLKTHPPLTESPGALTHAMSGLLGLVGLGIFAWGIGTDHRPS
jgi:hypothetical protein